MTKLEIYNALMADSPKLKIRVESLIPKMAKQIKKEKRFPAWKWDEYTHQESRNHYLICFYAPDFQSADKPIVHCLGLLEDDRQRIIVQWGSWMYRKNGSIDCLKSRYIGFFLGHFFSRYRERFWKGDEMTNNELICRYFSRNTFTIPLELNESIQRNYKQYGYYAEYAFQVPDGTCFIRHWNEGDERTVGEADCDFISVVVFLTFVNKGLQTDTQKRAIMQEGRKYVVTYYKNLFKDITKEAVFRYLDIQKTINNDKEQ